LIVRLGLVSYLAALVGKQDPGVLRFAGVLLHSVDKPQLTLYGVNVIRPTNKGDPVRYLAPIIIVGIIALAGLIAYLIHVFRTRDSAKVKLLKEQLALVGEQVAVTTRTLRTIRDLNGDSSFDAQMALDEVERLANNYNQKELA
jgi:hypothetical protein